MDDIQVSKLLSFVLRHDPGSVGLELHSGGWVPVDALVAALVSHGNGLDREQVERVVRTSDKQRFAIDARTDRIRANHGHSINVDLGLPAATPPERLFHGTPRRNLPSIEYQGLEHRHRLAVHLSTDADTARQVGARRGDPVVLAVDSGRMHHDGHRFSVAANGVWLVLHVPPDYLSRLSDSVRQE